MKRTPVKLNSHRDPTRKGTYKKKFWLCEKRVKGENPRGAIAYWMLLIEEETKKNRDTYRRKDFTRGGRSLTTSSLEVRKDWGIPRKPLDGSGEGTVEGENRASEGSGG